MISPRHRSFGVFNTKDLVLSKQYIMNGYLQQKNILHLYIVTFYCSINIIQKVLKLRGIHLEQQ